MKRLAFLMMATTAGALWALMVACSSDSGSTFNENPTDAASDGGLASFGDGSAVGPGAVTCTTAFPTNFASTYLAPGAPSGQCSPDQLGAYFDACLGANGSVDACTAFRAANAGCTACIEPDAGTGPVKTYVGQKYSQVNLGGCVAIEQGNAADGGACAIALQASDQCQVASCLGCIEKTGVTNATINDCKTQSKTKGCAPNVSGISTSCPLGYTGSDGGAYDCFPHGNEQASDPRSWITRVMGVYCGSAR